MAVSNEDLARLVVSLEATTTKYYNALRKAQQQTNSSANAIERRLTGMATNIDRTFANLGKRLSSNLTGPLAGIGAAFSVREVLRYADAWTEAGNQIAASSDITGIQARSLSDLRKVADDSRAGFEETVKLYTRIQRSAGEVATSEMDIARATSIVNKAFKAGGAATSEFNAGVLQLSQGLGSGVLQGDELRSVRENAPVLAKVIADYFGVTIAGLKELGSQGKLTSEEVFKAILAGETQIESAFRTTQATIADGFTKVRNALVEYVGSSDQSLGATVALNVGLNALADNFGVVADAGLKLAALVAGALVGRSLTSLVGTSLNAGRAVAALGVAMASASKGGASFATVLRAAGVAAGPIATVLGGLALLALQELSSQSIESAQSIEQTIESMAELGFTNVDTAAKIREAAESTDQLTESQRKLREEEQKRRYARAVVNEQDLRRGTLGDNLAANSPVFAVGTESLVSAFAVASRATQQLNALFSGLTESEREAVEEIRTLARGLEESTIPAQAVVSRLRELQQEPLSDEVLKLLDALDKVALRIQTVELAQIVNGGSQEIDAFQKTLADTIDLQIDLQNSTSDFANQDEYIAFVDRVDELVKGLREGTLSAEEVKAEINSLSSLSPTFGGIIAGLGGLINSLYSAYTQASNLKLLTDSLSVNSSVPTGGLVGLDASETQEIIKQGEARRKANAQFIKDQKEYNSLAIDERNIREEIDRIIKDAKGTSNVSFGDRPYENEELRSLAAENLALKEADRASNKSGKDSAKDLEKFRETIAEQERSNILLQEELALRAGLNPLIEDYGYALEKWRKEQELLNAAEDAGIALTPDLEKKIGLIAEAYASGTAALEKLQETQDKAKESLQEWLDLAKSATRSFIDDLIEGKSAAEALSNVLGQLGSKLIDIGLNTLFGGGGGGGGGLGIFGQLLTSIFPGRASGGPVRGGSPYIVGEKRPELFVPSQDGVIIPRVPTGMGGGGSVSTPIQINIDATGADNEGLARVQQELVNLRAQVPYLVRQQVSRRTQKGW